MSNPNRKRDRSKEDLTLGFLEDEAVQRPREGERPGGRDARYPVIRKPVPVSESGALRAPNSDTEAFGPGREPAPQGRAPSQDSGDDFDFLDDINLAPPAAARSSEFEDDWDRPGGYADDEEPSIWRRIALSVAIIALLSGAALFSLPMLKEKGLAFNMPEKLPFGLSLPFDIPGFGGDGADQTQAQNQGQAGELEQGDAVALIEPSAAPADAASTANTTSGSSLGERFRAALNEVEGLVANEQFEDAQRVLGSLDRSVYGYGATEFNALEAQIDNALGTSAAIAAEAAAEQRRQEEAEQARLAAADAERRAQEAAEALAQQQAAEKLAREQEAQAAAEAAARAEIQAQAQAEQRDAEERRAAARRRAIEQQAANDRLATDRAVAEQRAANERRAAEAQQAAEQRRLDEQVVASAPVNRPITDADLQQVYGQFSNLAIAIETGNINDVVSLTSPSSSRVQQFLQLFANSQLISARITDVATRNASGSVTGTLSIGSIVRANGSTVDAPANLRSIKLTSTRQGDGWSLIDW